MTRFVEQWWKIFQVGAVCTCQLNVHLIVMSATHFLSKRFFENFSSSMCCRWYGDSSVVWVLTLKRFLVLCSLDCVWGCFQLMGSCSINELLLWCGGWNEGPLRDLRCRCLLIFYFIWRSCTTSSALHIIFNSAQTNLSLKQCQWSSRWPTQENMEILALLPRSGKFWCRFASPELHEWQD